MAAKLTPCRILASLVNTLSPPHAPVHLVAPLASLAPLAPPHSHLSRLGSHQHTRLAGRVAVEAQRLHAGVCAQRVGELQSDAAASCCRRSDGARGRINVSQCPALPMLATDALDWRCRCAQHAQWCDSSQEGADWASRVAPAPPRRGRRWARRGGRFVSFLQNSAGDGAIELLGANEAIATDRGCAGDLR